MKIIFENQEYQIEQGVTIKEAFDKQINTYEIIAARYNNWIASLNQPIMEDGKISLIKRQE